MSAPRRKRAQGIAVITVLLALAIAVLISAEIIMRVYAGLKRTENSLNAQQAWQYALGGEAWARQRLMEDFKDDKEQRIDHLREEWALPAQTLPIDGGFIEIEIYDLHSRFNLNNLITEQGQIDGYQVEIFKRLLAYLGVNPVYADLAAQWASYADDTGMMYGTEELPYRAGDTHFGSVTELRLLRDMGMDEYARIAPFVSALPEYVPVNINTAPEPVLASLSRTAKPERVREFVEMRDSRKEGLSSGSEFINMMGIQDKEVGKDDLAVSSDYFEVRVRTEYNGRRAYLVSVIYRDPETGELQLLGRDRSQRFTFRNSLIRDGQNDADEEKNKDNDDEEETGNDGKQQAGQADDKPSSSSRRQPRDNRSSR